MIILTSNDNEHQLNAISEELLNIVQVSNKFNKFVEDDERSILEGKQPRNEKEDVARAQALVDKIEASRLSKDDRNGVLARQSLAAAISFTSGKIIKSIVSAYTDKEDNSMGSTLNGLLLSIMLNGIFSKVKNLVIKKDDNKKTINMALAIKYKLELQKIMKHLKPESKEYKLLAERMKTLNIEIKKAKESKTLTEASVVINSKENLTESDLLNVFEFIIYEDTNEDVQQIEFAIDRKIKEAKIRMGAAKKLKKTERVLLTATFINYALTLLAASASIFGKVSSTIPTEYSSSGVFKTLGKVSKVVSASTNKLVPITKLTGYANKVVKNKIFKLLMLVFTFNLSTFTSDKGKDNIEKGVINEINKSDLDTLTKEITNLKDMLETHLKLAKGNEKDAISKIISETDKQLEVINNYINK